MMTKDVTILSIEGVQTTDDQVKILYKLPPINSDMMKDFYRAFIIQLCENIAALEGAEGLFEVVEGEDD
jgi:hypothetical protein